jgi:6,7-dimethyl-8-ribityllumazine synthase
MRRDEMIKERPVRDASALTIGVVVSDFNSDITHALLSGTLETLEKWHVRKENIWVKHVPGGFEIPLGCLQLLEEHDLDAIVTLGCVLKGETKHDEYIAGAVADGIMRVMLEHTIPISFGVLTPNTLEQAQARSQGEANHGRAAAEAALEMALR